MATVKIKYKRADRFKQTVGQQYTSFIAVCGKSGKKRKKKSILVRLAVAPSTKNQDINRCFEKLPGLDVTLPTLKYKL